MKPHQPLLLLLVLICTAPALQAAPKTADSSAADQLYAEFQNPGNSARPRVWWHWMNGNITKEGIRKDIEWMHRAGIAGFHNFDAGIDTPQIVKERLPYMTPGWKDAFNFALDLADSLGMEVGVASSPGWSITGGPWVSYEDSEKKLVWSEMILDGDQDYSGPLPTPLTNCGPYQDILQYPDDPGKYEFYRDLFVLAVPVPQSEADALKPQITSGPSWIRFDYPDAQTVKSLNYVETTLAPVCLEYSTDGENFRTLIPELLISSLQVTGISQMNFAPTAAKSFRIRTLDPAATLDIRHAELIPSTRISMSYAKSGFWTDYHISDRYPTPDTPDAVGCVMDLTGKCSPDFTSLDWKVPAGKWRVIRFGWNLLGRINGPASPEATGLEVDKLDADAVRRYYDNYLSMYKDASNDRLGSAIKCLMIDSYESGKCSWTPDMEREFKKRRGYELRPWMPVLAGIVLHSAQESEQFLFDWRQTLGELLAENHYDIVNDILAPYGMTRYTEAHEERTAFVGDGMMVKRGATVPMSAIWARYRAGWHSSYPPAEADVRESSSVAHIYGQNICAAESFTTNGRIGKWDGTGAYQCGPFNLKRLADAAFSLGLNRFVIHTSVHQPCDDVFPGLGLGPYGQWFTRHDTWAEEARSWTDYLSRSSFLLQQGRWAADIAYFYGEDKNITGRFYDERICLPRGWNYDFVNADIICNVLQPQAGSLVAPSGMHYRMLVLDNEIRYMSLPVLKRILKLVRAGVPVYGDKPQAKAGRMGSERRFRRICSRIWDRGRANVYSGIPLAEAMAAAGIPKDVDFCAFDAAVPAVTDPHYVSDPDLRFVHRTLADGDIYWIANITEEPRELSVSLNVSGKRPELWNAENGSRSDVSYRFDGSRTTVDLHLEADDAQFIVLTEDTDVAEASVPRVVEREAAVIYGAWELSFQPGRGAPAHKRFLTLKSLTEDSEEGVRFFSGTVSYSKTFSYSGPVSGGLVIDLGAVHHMARVFVNGKDAGLAWHAPYRVDVSGLLHGGENMLEIRVTDSWANRLIGDMKKDKAHRITYTPHTFYLPDAEPIPSGLLGPVRILATD